MEIFHCDGFRKLQWYRAVERCENLGGQVVVIQDFSKENLGGTNNNPRSFEEEGFAFLSAKIGSGEGGVQLPPYPLVATALRRIASTTKGKPSFH